MESVFLNIMVAYDKSPEASNALNVAIELAASLKSELIIASVVEPPPFYANFAVMTFPDLPDMLNEASTEDLQGQLQAAAKLARDRGLSVIGVVKSGSEVPGIIAIARQQKADLLVIGLRKHGTFGPLGGTLHEVAQQSPCPVLAVNADIASPAPDIVLAAGF
jgi:nucleotide-binding universal stress UspA family protein